MKIYWMQITRFPTKHIFGTLWYSVAGFRSLFFSPKRFIEELFFRPKKVYSLYKPSKILCYQIWIFQYRVLHCVEKYPRICFTCLCSASKFSGKRNLVYMLLSLASSIISLVYIFFFVFSSFFVCFCNDIVGLSSNYELKYPIGIVIDRYEISVVVTTNPFYIFRMWPTE